MGKGEEQRLEGAAEEGFGWGWRRREDGGHGDGGSVRGVNSRNCRMRDGAAEPCSHARVVQGEQCLFGG